MRKLSVLALALGASLALASPAFAILDFSASAEYVTGGTIDWESTIVPFTGSDSYDLDGGILLKAQLSFLGITVGAESYTDSVDASGGGDVKEMALKAGYGFGLPGFDITALATVEGWQVDDFEMVNILLGVDALITVLPVLDVEVWYNTSVSAEAQGDLESVPGIDAEGSSYGLRVIYELAAGFGVSAGYRYEKHEFSSDVGSMSFENKGITLGATFIF